MESNEFLEKSLHYEADFINCHEPMTLFEFRDDFNGTAYYPKHGPDVMINGHIITGLVEFCKASPGVLYILAVYRREEMLMFCADDTYFYQINISRMNSGNKWADLSKIVSTQPDIDIWMAFSFLSI